MSIANFVAASIAELHARRYDTAMSLVCSAIDGTTAKALSQSETSNNKRFKTFLEENMRLITHYGFPGINAGGIRIKCINIPDLKTDQDGYVSIADIIYHIIRCSVIHECSIDERIEFTEQTYIGDFEIKFRIPRKLIIGLLAAVVQSPKNSDEPFEKDILATIGLGCLEPPEQDGQHPVADTNISTWYFNPFYDDLFLTLGMSVPSKRVGYKHVNGVAIANVPKGVQEFEATLKAMLAGQRDPHWPRTGRILVSIRIDLTKKEYC